MLKSFPPPPQGALQTTLFPPEASWRPPGSPLRSSHILGLDTETRDPNLKTLGPGYTRKDGYVVGISVANEHGAQYLPFKHLGGDNLDEAVVVGIVRRLIADADEVIMANATYDLGWLETLGIKVHCPVRDVQVAEALLDEERQSYSLDTLSMHYLKRGKQEDALAEAAKHFKVDPKGEMWKLPARYVGTYAEYDAINTLEIYKAQKPLLVEDNLFELFELESKITKICVKMSIKGVPVDLKAAEKLNTSLLKEEEALLKRFSFDIWSGQQIGSWVADFLKLSVPRTEKGNFSVTKDWLANSGHCELQKLNELRGLQRLRKVFIEDGILKTGSCGKIFPDFVQVARDDGGTRSGRFSCKNPNLQQVPKRSALGKQIRKLYIAEPGAFWAKADYSSQEPRLQVHYALRMGLPGAEEARDAFIQGIKLYTFLERLTGLDYDTCKMLMLGLGYGMGLKKLAETLGVDPEEARATKDKFNEKAPFISMLFDRCMAKATQKGSIRTLLNRKARFDFWKPVGYRTFDSDQPVSVKGWSKAAAIYNTRNLEREFTSKALNRLIQGSAADQTKLAMVLCDEAGLDLRLPVHDELNAMVESEKEAKLMCEIMENAIELKLPSVADLDLGTTWC